MSSEVGPLATASQKRDWLVLSIKYSVDWNLVWYCTGCAGYTSSLMIAGRFTEAEAKANVVLGVTMAVPLADVWDDNHGRYVVSNTTPAMKRLERLAKRRVQIRTKKERKP